MKRILLMLASLLLVAAMPAQAQVTPDAESLCYGCVTDCDETSSRYSM